jgi:hypothetical protein
VIIDRSMTDSLSDLMPIFIIRLVADSGGTRTGGLDQLGSVGLTIEIRSCTICRASSRLVPRLKYSLTADRPGTDFERIVSIAGIPARASSRGIVTSASTSAAARPSEGVWISTSGGANSGNTSTGMRGIWVIPKASMPTAIASTRNRNFRLVATRYRSISDSDALAVTPAENPAENRLRGPTEGSRALA